MIFSSLEFLFLFFPIVFGVYLFLPPKSMVKNLWLFVSSLFFYFIGAQNQLGLLLIVILIAYVEGLCLSILQSNFKKRISLILSIGVMLLIMIYFKYFSFFIININTLFKTDYNIKNIALPIGISFFIFQAISYVIDVYRGEQALINPIDMGLYISFFPQLIAGPIVRFHDINEYLNVKYRILDINKISDGLWRFSIGLCKKILIANNLGGLTNLVFGVKNISEFSVLYTWLGAVAYTLQIYYDFSGYSDMAIGLGKIFGFEFQENFNFPYSAKSVKDFWRRWHISLSQFFRDYVYIPLGGNRCSKGNWILNLLVVWLLTGLWHGASWNYIIWGVSYGILQLIESSFINKLPENIFIIFIRRCLTILSIIILWVVFKCEDLYILVKYLKNMLGIGASSFIDNAFIFQATNFSTLIIISTFLALPIKKIPSNTIKNNKIYNIIITILLFLGVISSISYIYMGSYNPFLYFMF